MIIHQKKFKLKIYYSEKFSKATGIEIQSQNWGRDRKLLMEGIDVKYFQLLLILEKMNKDTNTIPIYVMTMQNMYVIHMLIWFIY